MWKARDWTWLPQTFDASILSDEATAPGLPNFTGAFVGMACQDLAGTARPADFDYFEYRGTRLQCGSTGRHPNAGGLVTPMPPTPSLDAQVQAALTWLKRHSTKRTRDGMARYGLPSEHALGVSIADVKRLGARLGRNHELAVRSVEDRRVRGAPAHVVCRRPGAGHVRANGPLVPRFRQLGHLRHGLLPAVRPHAARLVEGRASGADRREEFVKRAAFALLASLALHDKAAGDAPFLDSLRLIERAAGDERNFVKKGVSWALRAVGRRNPVLNAAAVEVARRLAASPEAAPRWVGKDAVRELTSAAVIRQLASR